MLYEVITDRLAGPTRLLENLFDLARKKAEGVDEVHAGLVDQKTRHSAEIRLPREIRILAPAVPRPRVKGERV